MSKRFQHSLISAVVVVGGLEEDERERDFGRWKAPAGDLKSQEVADDLQLIIIIISFAMIYSSVRPSVGPLLRHNQSSKRCGRRRRIMCEKTTKK